MGFEQDRQQNLGGFRSGKTVSCCWNGRAQATTGLTRNCPEANIIFPLSQDAYLEPESAVGLVVQRSQEARGRRNPPRG